jgi:D-beta-D-heptose 7-phosphate kinase/D-beta-D-heptose 1-phosphate adenosyltransferase
MMDINYEKAEHYIRQFKEKRILILGDLMLDEYIWGNVSRISPEAPVPVVEVKRDSSCFGGAGNVAFNVESLGAFHMLVGVVGKDIEGRWIKDNVSYNRGIFEDESRPTCVKTRIIAHQQQIVRVDREHKSPISSLMEEKIFDFIEQEKFDGIIISDYNKGTLTRSLLEKVLSLAQERDILVFVDPKVEHFSLFSPVTLITPNHFEAERIVHHQCRSDEEVERAGDVLLSQITSSYIILKRGEQGMSIFEKEKKAIHIPTNAIEVYDVTGAGDTVIATASLALLSGATIREAASMANTAAGIVVGKIGTAAVSAAELLSAIKHLS